jgi:hypothetical protein
MGYLRRKTETSGEPRLLHIVPRLTAWLAFGV